MSYSRLYTGSVNYLGSKTVSYPATQNGGTMTVGYSGSVPVNITINVDTNAFDMSLMNCNNAVNGLTTAITATEAAQIAAKRQASKKIAASIIKGFFDYVGADLSQKMKELSSKCESLLIALIGHKDNCLQKSNQMKDDYNRISKRYSKLFSDLDKETVSRIEVLDQPVFHFAMETQKVIDRGSNTGLLGISTISANENIRLETILSCSHMKQQANTLIDKTNKYLAGTYKLANSVRDMLGDSNITESIFVPVMYFESVMSDGNKNSNIVSSDSKYSPTETNTANKIKSGFNSDKTKWCDMDSSEYDKVISYINVEVQSGGIEERTLQTMLELMNNQSIQTIKA